MAMSSRDWAGIPVHLLNQIVIKIKRFADFLRFHAVCQQWLCAALDTQCDNKMKLDSLKVSRRKLPMLMFKTKENSDDARVLYSVSDKIIYHVKLPLPCKHRFVGSSNGWLFYLDEDMVITMVNPYTDSTLSLPRLKDPILVHDEEWRKKYLEYYIQKMIISWDTHINPNGFVVALIHGDMSELAFFRSDEPSWVFIDGEWEYLINHESDRYYVLEDITFYKGDLYGLTVLSKVVKIDTAARKVYAIIPASNIQADCLYLVESQEGELLLIERQWIPNAKDHFDDDDYVDNIDGEGDDLPPSYFTKSYEIKVFKLTPRLKKKYPHWVQTNDIGEQALFIGDNHSVSVSTRDYPGCLPNSIYYTTQHHILLPTYVFRGPNEDQGVFNIGTETFSSHHVLDSSQKYTHPPIWFVPNPMELPKIDSLSYGWV